MTNDNKQKQEISEKEKAEKSKISENSNNQESKELTVEEKLKETEEKVIKISC